MQNYRLCLDNKWRYTFDCLHTANNKIPFYRYLKVSEVPNISDAYKITSKVIWYQKWYHEYEVDTIITDWKRL
jgi:hypothetical protein